MRLVYHIFWSTPRCVEVKSEKASVRLLREYKCAFRDGLIADMPPHCRYPIRDPFFNMLPRSLSNFMNAFTSADHTTYPFATTNRQDFQNLLSVYLDATLHPLLKEEDFRQEGWRLGPEDPRSILTQGEQSKGNLQSEDVVFKGVVYNEMKGQISDANYLYYIKYRESICPSLNNSGGDPQYITDLTHQQLGAEKSPSVHPARQRRVLTAARFQPCLDDQKDNVRTDSSVSFSFSFFEQHFVT